MRSLRHWSRWNAHPWNCPGCGSWGQGLVLEPFSNISWTVFQKNLVQVEITGWDVEAAPGRDGWDQKMRTKGAISWLFVIPRIFAASRFKGGFWTLGFQICFQPKSGKFPTRISLNQLYFCWFLKYGAQQVQGTSLCTTDSTKINFSVVWHFNSSSHGFPNSNWGIISIL